MMVLVSLPSLKIHIQIKTTRADWHSPSEYSCVCGKHFTEDSFQPQSLVSGIYMIIIYSYIYNMYIDKLGIKRKKLLLPEAVPTIFPIVNHYYKAVQIDQENQRLFRRENVLE